MVQERFIVSDGHPIIDPVKRRREVRLQFLVFRAGWKMLQERGCVLSRQLPILNITRLDLFSCVSLFHHHLSPARISIRVFSNAHLPRKCYHQLYNCRGKVKVILETLKGSIDNIPESIEPMPLVVHVFALHTYEWCFGS